MTLSNSEVVALVGDAKVDKRVYTDQAIFDLEMERIFEQTWVYVAHESQVAKPGDYMTTEIGKQDVILTRDEKSKIHIFYNRCTHRGAKLTIKDSGNVQQFVCNFHAYCFKTDGTLASIPLEDSYEDSGYGRCSPEMNLREVADVESYRGFIFARLRPGKIDLHSWLGDTKKTLDNFVDRAPEAEVEVVGRPYRWINPCNWKMLVENIVDGAHVVGTHPSIGQTGARLAKEYEVKNEAVPAVLQMAKGFWQPAQVIREMGVTVLENGHAYNGGRFSLHSGYSEVGDYVEALKNAYGEQRTDEILLQQRHNTGFYPNMHMKTMIQKIRIFKPVSPSKTLVECWVFRLKGAPDEILQRTLSYAEMLDSPATLVSSDDAEVMMRMQHGLETEAEQWVSMHRGLKRPVEKENDALHCEGDTELAFIHQYNVWKRLMCGETV